MKSLSLLYDRLMAAGLNCAIARDVCDLALAQIRRDECFRLQVGHLWLSGHMTAHGLEMEP